MNFFFEIFDTRHNHIGRIVFYLFIDDFFILIDRKVIGIFHDFFYWYEETLLGSFAFFLALKIGKAARIEGGKLMADKFGFVGETL